MSIFKICSKANGNGDGRFKCVGFVCVFWVRGADLVSSASVIDGSGCGSSTGSALTGVEAYVYILVWIVRPGAQR